MKVRKYYSSDDDTISNSHCLEKLQLLTELAEEAIVSIQADQSICVFNPAAERMFGYSREEILGKPLGELLPKHLRELHSCHVRTFLGSSDVGRSMGERQELVGLRKDGSTFSAQAAIFRSTLRDGRTELTAILRDISGDKYIKEVEESVRLSRQIQLHFFPQKFPELPGVDLSAANVPSQVISGDYYDFIEIVKGQWGLVVADVAGKGLSAGLMMSAFRASLLAEIRNNYSISTIMTKVNNLLWETSAENRFVTAFYGVFDERQRVLTYCNAGHNFPLLIRSNGAIQELETGGMLLGAFQDCSYQEGRVVFSPEDWLLIYTDGLIDSLSPSGEELGREGLIQFLQSLPKQPASSICQSLIEWTKRATLPPGDDISLLVMKLTD